MRWARSLRATSTRTFIAFPLLAFLEAAVSGRRLRPQFVPLMLWGYLQYRLAGSYRRRLGGGGPGMGKPPERLVTSGPFAVSRNPMYLGHLLFFMGMYLVLRSPLAAALGLAHVPWFRRRVARDEQRLDALFGDEYRDYCRRVPRWAGIPRRGRYSA